MGKGKSIFFRGVMLNITTLQGRHTLSDQATQIGLYDLFVFKRDSEH